MNPYRAYRRPGPSSGWTRIDLLLALYDGALERLDKAEAVLKEGNTAAAVPLLSRTQLIVNALAGGVRPGVNDEMTTNILRLYDFVVRELCEPRLEAVASARKVLATLREGFESIRNEANELERAGRLQSAEQLQMVLATA